jgi:hypothetical protein
MVKSSLIELIMWEMLARKWKASATLHLPSKLVTTGSPNITIAKGD